MKNIQNRKIYIAILITLFLLVTFLFKEYLITIFTAFIFSLLLRPLFLKFNQKLNNSTWSFIFVAFILFSSILVPAALISIFGIREVSSIINEFRYSNQSDNVNLPFFASRINEVLRNIPGLNLQISVEDIKEFLANNLNGLSNSLFSNSLKIGSAFLEVIPQTIIFITAFWSFTTDFDRYRKLFHKLSPFNEETDLLLLNRISSLSKSLILGTILIGLIQGLASAVLFKLVGLNHVLILGILISIASIIPLGAGIIVYPFGIYLLLSGNTFAGSIVLVIYALLISNIDNILRPKFMPKEVKLDSFLTILGVLGGIQTFGFIGILIGPIILIILLTTLEIYFKKFNQPESSNTQ